MEYWTGLMNWPIKDGWLCETCGECCAMIWGLVNGECRCSKCHTVYMMKDDDGKITNVPISGLKEEYKEPAKKAWEVYKKPISLISDEEWDKIFESDTDETPTNRKG